MKPSPQTTWLPDVTSRKLLRFLWFCKIGSLFGYVSTMALLNAMIFLPPSPREWFLPFLVSAVLTVLLFAGRLAGLLLQRLDHRRSYRVFEREVRRKVKQAQTRLNIVYAGANPMAVAQNVQFIQSRLGDDQYIHGTTNYTNDGLDSHLYFVDVAPNRSSLSPLVGHLCEHKEPNELAPGKQVGYSLSTLKSSQVFAKSKGTSEHPVHAVVFVADARRSNHQANLEEWTWLTYFLKERSVELSTIPLVVQVTHASANDAIPASSILLALEVPSTTQTQLADPKRGDGVLDTWVKVLQGLQANQP